MKLIRINNWSKSWFLGTKRHRVDGPAIDEGEDGFRAWYQHGELHRVGGPAIEWPNGNSHWYTRGVPTKRGLRTK